jgi:enamine deaminase RidA (YjgF/YER057c/UK114 family)
MSEIKRIVTSPKRGRVAVFNGVLYIGGQGADDRTADIRGQTSQTLAKLDKLLTDAGISKSRLLSVQIWMKDITRDFAVMNEVWDGWVDVNDAPARATAECKLAVDDALIEIIATAAA